jgi:transcriptional regulator with PAS, ATPase and Fis domain
VGGLSDIHVDVRIVAATNRDLAEEVNAGRFRADLFYRLNVLPLSLPPLRAHPEDITPLLAFYIEYFNQEFRKTVQGVSGDAAQLLTAYRWPGNVRELRNAVERAMLLTAHDTLARDDFPIPQSSLKAQHVDLPSTGLRLDKLEETFVRQALDRTTWNRTQAGKLLGMSRSQVQSRMDRLAMAVPQFVNRADAELE